MQKDIVKGLGARFDFQKKSWYVEENKDLTPFFKWLHPEERKLVSVSPNVLDEGLLIAASHSTSSHANVDDSKVFAQLPPSMPLLNLLQSIGQSIQQNFMQPIWVSAEISQIKNYKQHHYLELVQRGENKSEELAKVRATIWSSRQSIIRQFEEQTGKSLVADLQVLLQVKCNFHERYGLSLDILQINAEYTLGQMQRKINAIRKTLQSKGIYANNKEKPLPKILHSICVISPENAAGLADFKHYLTPLTEQQLCHCDYYTAVFQGEEANRSLTNCLHTIQDKQIEKNYQLIVIIRGGGSITDLQFLEEYEINEAVCLAPLPVWVGLGHQTDKLLINEVAHRHFPTPTAVAKQILEHILSPLRNAVAQWHEISLLSKQRLIAEKERMQERRFLLHKYCHQVTKKAEQKLSIEYATLRIRMHEKTRRFKEGIDSNYLAIPMKIRALLQEKKQSLRNHKKDLQKASLVHLQEYKSHLQLIYSILQNSHPKKILKRGFAIIRDEKNQPLKDLNQVQKKNKVMIEMNDGSVEANIEKKHS